MHEMSLVHNVVDVILTECERHGIKKVKTVYITVGEARDIVVDLFENLFRYLAKGTPAEEAEVRITTVPLTVCCNKCGSVFSIDIYDQKSWTCPGCGAFQDYHVNSGLEFRIDSLAPGDPDETQQETGLPKHEKELSSVG